MARTEMPNSGAVPRALKDLDLSEALQRVGCCQDDLEELAELGRGLEVTPSGVFWTDGSGRRHSVPAPTLG